MENLEKINKPMSPTEVAVKASYQVVVTDNDLNPQSMGSGALLYYKQRLFFVTVAHVTNKKDTIVTIETNRSPVGGKTPNYSIGQMNYIDMLRVEDLVKLKEQGLDEETLKYVKTLDFAFAELKEPVGVIQNAMDFKHHGKVSKSTKIIIPEDELASLPDADEPILFYGTINVARFGQYLERQPKLTVDVKYIGEEDNDFYKFELPQITQDEAEYKGTSGAPVFDTRFNFLGLISYGYVGTPYIYAFKNTSIKHYLDLYIQSNS